MTIATSGHCRTAARFAAVAAAIGTALLGTTVLAQTGPIKIGVVSAKQGVFAEPGTAAANGAQMAVEQAGAKLLGQTVQVLWYDDPSPQGAQQNISKLIDEDKVVAVVGGTNSASSLAMSAVAKRAKVPLVVTAGSTREITGKDCNRYTFRTQLTIPVASRAIAPVVLEKGKKWYFLSASYAFGQDIYTSMNAALKQAGGQELAYDQVPIGTNDYSSFILKIRQAKPDALIAGLGGNDLNNLLKQMAEYGLKDTATVAAPVVTDLAMWAVGPEAATGIYAKHWQYSDPANSGEEKQFATAWQAKYGKPPAVEAWQGWMSMRMLLAAIEKAKATDSASIIKSLESVKLQAGTMPVYYREWDHQFIHPVLVVKGQAPKGKDKWDMLEVIRKVPASASEVDALYGSKAEVGCTLGEL